MKKKLLPDVVLNFDFEINFNQWNGHLQACEKFVQCVRIKKTKLYYCFEYLNVLLPN